MIEIAIGIKDDKVLDKYKTNETTMSEVGIALLKLEHIKQDLLSIEFETDVEIDESKDAKFHKDTSLSGK